MTKTSIEDQLTAYRARKKKEEAQGESKKVLWNIVSRLVPLGWSSQKPQSLGATVNNVDECVVDSVRRRATGAHDPQGGSDDGPAHNPLDFQRYTRLDWVSLALMCVMWLILFKIFILIEFGAVFFIFSAFSFIWYNLRSGPKRKGEVSAYSVFNPNCESIDGTLSAEQFEREILHKM